MEYIKVTQLPKENIANWKYVSEHGLEVLSYEYKEYKETYYTAYYLQCNCGYCEKIIQLKYLDAMVDRHRTRVVANLLHITVEFV